MIGYLWGRFLDNLVKLVRIDTLDYEAHGRLIQDIELYYKRGMTPPPVQEPSPPMRAWKD